MTTFASPYVQTVTKEPGRPERVGTAGLQHRDRSHISRQTETWLWVAYFIVTVSALAWWILTGLVTYSY